MQSLPDFSSATQRLSPKEYRDLLRELKLVDMKLEAVSARLDHITPADPDTLDIAVLLESKLLNHDSEAPVMVLDCVLRTSAGDEQICEIAATYRLSFSADEVLPLDFFAIYQKNSAYGQVWPFLRELAYSLTSRMGIRPLTLPLLTADVKFRSRTAESP